MNLYDEINPVNTVEESNSLLAQTFFRMFLGVLASAIIAFYTYSSGLFVDIFLSGSYKMLFIAEFVVVFIFSLLFKKLSPTIVTVLFFGYAILNGLTLSVIFAVYSMESIGYVFLATSALFGILAYLGYKTDKDLTNFGTVLSVALIVGLVLTIINFFLKSSMFEIILDWAILGIFFGLTVYDTNKIIKLNDSGLFEPEKLYVYGAMELYLDFINIFLRILSLFGKRK